jgi:hypothetical protein
LPGRAVQCARYDGGFTGWREDDGNGPTIMHIRAWHGGIRDARADWRDWSRTERLAAALLLVATIGALLLVL